MVAPLRQSLGLWDLQRAVSIDTHLPRAAGYVTKPGGGGMKPDLVG